jgi:hypothetical protein
MASKHQARDRLLGNYEWQVGSQWVESRTKEFPFALRMGRHLPDNSLDLRQSLTLPSLPVPCPFTVHLCPCSRDDEFHEHDFSQLD